MGQWFTPDAYVVDRGRLFKGLPSLVAWQMELDALYPDRVLEPLKCTRSRGGNDYYIRMRITGGFPGTGMRLGYRFRMRGDCIAMLEIG
jgi:hypothetical protein